MARARAPTNTQRASRPALEVLRPSPDPDFRQERSRRSYLALIEAATELFGKLGYDAVGTPEIASAAGVSVGTFYRYFDDKHEVYLEICRRHMSAAYRDTIEGLTPARFVGQTRSETITASVAVLFAHILRRPELARSLMEMSLRDASVAEIRRAFERASWQKLTELISAICPRDVVPDPDATAYVLYGSALQCAYSLAGSLGPPPIDAARATAALATFIERALFPR